MKIRASFLLSLFAILLLLPSELFACTCCAEYGHYSLSYSKPNEYALEEMQKINFSSGQLYMTAAGEEDVKGITSIGESYKVSGMLKDGAWKLNFTDNKNNSGTLTLPMPEKVVDFMVDIHDGNDGGAGSPLLYKEWRFKANVKNGTGIFQNGVKDKAEYFLVLQGRGNVCTSAEDFKNWRLEITGKNANYAFYGKTNAGIENSESNTLIEANSAGNIRLGMTVAEARKAMSEAKFSRTSDGEGIALISVMKGDTALMSLYAGEEDYDAPINENAKIEFIEVWSPEFKTAEGVHPDMKIMDAEKIYGKVLKIMMSEIESREFAEFIFQPKDLTFRLYGKDSNAGVYQNGKNTTSKYSPNAYIAAIQISN